MTLTAAYEALTYKVKFLYLGETIGAGQSVKYGENLVLPSGEDAGLPNEIRIVGWKRRGDGSIISPSEFDTVARSDTYDAVIETDEAEKLTVSGFRTNGFYLYDKYAAGDDASAIVTFKNGKTFALRKRGGESIPKGRSTSLRFRARRISATLTCRSISRFINRNFC